MMERLDVRRGWQHGLWSVFFRALIFTLRIHLRRHQIKCVRTILHTATLISWEFLPTIYRERTLYEPVRGDVRRTGTQERQQVVH